MPKFLKMTKQPRMKRTIIDEFYSPKDQRRIAVRVVTVTEMNGRGRSQKRNVIYRPGFSPESLMIECSAHHPYLDQPFSRLLNGK